MPSVDEKKSAVKKQRVRPTNKSIESQRFTTVKLPKSSEVVAQSKIHELEQRTATTPAGGFDPIPNDGMFVVVQDSQFWPPPPLEELMRSLNESGQSHNMPAENDGMDMYDRRADDAAAKAAKMKVVKAIGEVSHPRGKVSKNVKVLFDNDD
jgi:hypothetical protein